MTSCNCLGSPWIVGGSFNSLVKLDEKNGGDPVLMGEIKDFMDCVDTCGL